MGGELLMRIPDHLLPHKRLVSYKPKTGAGAYGDVFGDEVICERALIVDSNTLVRGPAGDEVVSSADVHLDPEHIIPGGSLITIWRGLPRERETRVISSELFDFPRLPSNQIIHAE